MEVFQRWKHLVLSDDPYTVVIGTEMTLERLAEELRLLPFEYKITELGRSIRVKGVGAKVEFSMGAGQEDFF